MSTEDIVFEHRGTVAAMLWGHRPCAVGWIGCGLALTGAVLLAHVAVQTWQTKQALNEANAAAVDRAMPQRHATRVNTPT